MADSSPLEAPLVGISDGERSRWRRPVLSVAVVASGVVAVTIVGLLLLEPFNAGKASSPGKASADQASASVPKLLEVYPRPASVKQVNELLGRLPAHDMEEAVFQHIQPHAEHLFHSFLRHYGSSAPHFKSGLRVNYRHKIEDGDEFKYRLGVFEDSLREVIRMNNFEAQHNSRPDRAIFGVNKFADWTVEEFKTLLKRPPNRPNSTRDAFTKTMQATSRSDDESSSNQKEKPGPPCTKNWAAEYPSIFKARNQGACGSCYAFAAAEEIRTMAFLNTGVDVGELSVQSVLDCKGDGCAGGDAGDVMEWVHKRGGISRKLDYGTYHAFKNQQCKSGVPHVVTTAGPERFYHEESTAKKLCKSGPLSMGVYSKPWHHYLSGVMSHHSCPYGHAVDHDVQVVGVFEHKGAFLIRNSWGTDWGLNATTLEPADPGDGGFILMEYGQKTCGNVDCNSFPKDVALIAQPPSPTPAPAIPGWIPKCIPFVNCPSS